MCLWIVLGFWCWNAVGFLGFAYWWSHQFGALTLRYVFLGLLAGLVLGPVTWLVGWDIHYFDRSRLT